MSATSPRTSGPGRPSTSVTWRRKYGVLRRLLRRRPAGRTKLDPAQSHFTPLLIAGRRRAGSSPRKRARRPASPTQASPIGPARVRRRPTEAIRSLPGPGRRRRPVLHRRHQRHRRRDHPPPGRSRLARPQGRHRDRLTQAAPQPPGGPPHPSHPPHPNGAPRPASAGTGASRRAGWWPGRPRSGGRRGRAGSSASSVSCCYRAG